MSKQIKKLCQFAHKDICECIDENCIAKSVFWDNAFAKLMEQKRYPIIFK